MNDSFCCEDMRYHATNHCPVHDSPYECPDWLIVRDDLASSSMMVAHPVWRYDIAPGAGQD